MDPRNSPSEETPQKHAALNDWQIEEIKRGLVEAERGDFAADDELKRTLRKWIHGAG
jgi:predicted transcriptional regulator